MYLGGRETTTNRTGVDYAECVPGWQRDNYQQDGIRLTRLCNMGGKRQLPTGRSNYQSVYLVQRDTTNTNRRLRRWYLGGRETTTNRLEYTIKCVPGARENYHMTGVDYAEVLYQGGIETTPTGGETMQSVVPGWQRDTTTNRTGVTTRVCTGGQR